MHICSAQILFNSEEGTEQAKAHGQQIQDTKNSRIAGAEACLLFYSITTLQMRRRAWHSSMIDLLS